ncbi:MAG: hypothetical protein V4467_00860 [Patescibacteria group bacterium]
MSENPSPLEKPPQENIPYPEMIAGQKLETLMSPEFRTFAVRFVNFQQYKEYLEAGMGDSGGRGFQAYGEVVGVMDQSFPEFLKESSKDWGESIHEYTDWPQSRVGIKVHEQLTEIFRNAHTEALKSVGSKDELRERSLEIFRDIILKKARSIREKKESPGYDGADERGALNRNPPDSSLESSRCIKTNE